MHHKHEYDIMSNSSNPLLHAKNNHDEKIVIITFEEQATQVFQLQHIRNIT